MQNKKEKIDGGSFTYKFCPLFPGPEYRSIFMTEVFELTYHGGGGFTYSEVWNMDVPKRRFNLKKISEHLEKMEEARNKEHNKLTEKSESKKDPKKIDIPDYVRNAPQTRPASSDRKTGPQIPAYISKVKSKN